LRSRSLGLFLSAGLNEGDGENRDQIWAEKRILWAGRKQSATHTACWIKKTVSCQFTVKWKTTVLPQWGSLSRRELSRHLPQGSVPLWRDEPRF
jgi:hypothetical protein